MFGFSWGEALVVAVVALLLLGPDKMPEAARKAGLAYGRLRRLLIETQAALRAEMDLAALNGRPPAGRPPEPPPPADDSSDRRPLG